MPAAAISSASWTERIQQDDLSPALCGASKIVLNTRLRCVGDAVTDYATETERKIE